jgi:hypothetical protein
VDFRANRLAAQDLEKVLKTLATSILISAKESESADLELFSLKMLRESSAVKPQTENQFSSMSSATWKEWVTEQRQEYSQRVKLAHLIRESESSSWGTPNWSTPTVMDTANIQQPRKPNPSGGQKPPLCQEVMNFPTPSVAGCVEGGVAKNVEMTPTGFKATRENGTSYGAKLRDAVLTFPTPTARDWKGCGNATPRKDGKSRMDNLDAVVKFGQADPTNPSTNGKSHALNPSWVEQLMGLPVGWTDLGYWGTE